MHIVCDSACCLRYIVRVACDSGVIVDAQQHNQWETVWQLRG